MSPAARIPSGVGTSRRTQKVDTARSRAKDASPPSARSRPISAPALTVHFRSSLSRKITYSTVAQGNCPSSSGSVKPLNASEERGLLKAQTQVSDDKEIFADELRHCTLLHLRLPDCRCGDLKSADRPTLRRCQTADANKVNTLGRRKAAVWSKLLSFEKKF
jgi:hypothetical protein